MKNPLRKLQEVLSDKGGVLIKGNGKSMWPFISAGNLLAVNSLKFEEIRTGDIVVYKNCYDKFRIHRVIEKNSLKKELTTRGDWAINTDRPVKEKDILGVVFAVQKKYKWIFIRSFVFRFLGLFTSKILFKIKNIFKFILSL